MQICESFVVLVLICSTLPPAFAALRVSRLTNMPGARTPTLRLKFFWNDLEESFSVLMILPRLMTLLYTPSVSISGAPLDGAVVAVVIGISRPAAAILCPLLAPDLLSGMDHFVAEPGEQGVRFAYSGDGGRANVQTEGALGDDVLLLLMCGPFED